MLVLHYELLHAFVDTRTILSRICHILSSGALADHYFLEVKYGVRCFLVKLGFVFLHKYGQQYAWCFNLFTVSVNNCHTVISPTLLLIFHL